VESRRIRFRKDHNTLFSDGTAVHASMVGAAYCLLSTYPKVDLAPDKTRGT
jgi:hypothetical protein